MHVVKDAADQPSLLRGLTVDITERRRAEEALRESEARLRAIAEATPVPLMISAVQDARVIYMNDHTLRLLGAQSRDDIGANLSAADFFIHPALIDNFPNAALEAIACGLPDNPLPVGGLLDMVRPGISGYDLQLALHLTALRFQPSQPIPQ